MTALPLATTDGLHPGTATTDMTSPALPEMTPMLPLKMPKAPRKGRPKTVRRENLEKKPFIREIGGNYGDVIKLPLELRDALHLGAHDTIVLWKDNDTVVLRKVVLAIKADELIIAQGDTTL